MFAHVSYAPLSFRILRNLIAAVIPESQSTSVPYRIMSFRRDRDVDGCEFFSLNQLYLLSCLISCNIVCVGLCLIGN